VEAGKSGKHFFRYDWQAPSSDKATPKLGYTVYLDKWDLIIGTQVNLDDLDTQVQAIAVDRHERIGSYTSFILAIAAGLLLLVAIGIRPAKSSSPLGEAKTWCALKFKWTPFLAF
jgi:methyl-accepting chemotaxis protein